MIRNKIFVVHKSNGYKPYLSKIIAENSVDFWAFFGEDALIPYQLEISILNKIKKIHLHIFLLIGQISFVLHTIHLEQSIQILKIQMLIIELIVG